VCMMVAAAQRFQSCLCCATRVSQKPAVCVCVCVGGCVCMCACVCVCVRVCARGHAAWERELPSMKERVHSTVDRAPHAVRLAFPRACASIHINVRTHIFEFLYASGYVSARRLLLVPHTRICMSVPCTFMCVCVCVCVWVCVCG